MHLLVLYSYRIIFMPSYGLSEKKVNFGGFFEHHSVAEQYVFLKCLYQSARFHSTETTIAHTHTHTHTHTKSVLCRHEEKL